MILSAVLCISYFIYLLEINASFSWRQRRTLLRQNPPILGVSPRVNICPERAVPWHIPPDICFLNKSFQVTARVAVHHWINKSGSFNPSIVSSARFPGQETLGALQIIQYIFIYFTIDFSCFLRLTTCKLLLPINMAASEKQISAFRSKSALVAV